MKMQILAATVHYKTAPVEVRERLSFTDEKMLAEGMAALKEKKSILENVILSTCNRTEVYAVVDQIHTARYYIKEFLAEFFGQDLESIAPYIRFHENEEAVRHLMKVTCGLDSMVLGETQILGQVRTSFFIAQKAGATGIIFNRLFKDAITLAKKAHTRTEIGKHAVSVSYAAVELGKKVLGGLQEKKVLVIGAGKMGELTVENLYSNGAKHITIVNRTYEKAKELAEKFSGKARPAEELADCLTDADIVISSTGSEEYILTKPMIEPIVKEKEGPLFMVDIAVPRDIDPEIGGLPSVHLYDIDDLEDVVNQNLEERKKAAGIISGWIDEGTEQFYQWIQTLGVVPLIAALREKALKIQEQTMESIVRKIPDLTERERKVISKHTKSIINQMLRDPIQQIKELAGRPDADQALYYFRKIFNLEDITPGEDDGEQREMEVGRTKQKQAVQG